MKSRVMTMLVALTSAFPAAAQSVLPPPAATPPPISIRSIATTADPAIFQSARGTRTTGGIVRASIVISDQELSHPDNLRLMAWLIGGALITACFYSEREVWAFQNADGKRTAVVLVPFVSPESGGLAVVGSF